MSRWRSVAQVESPLQFLGVVEAHARGVLGTDTQVVLRDPYGSIAPTVTHLKNIGLPSGIKISSQGTQPGLGFRSSTRENYVQVLGDPFSGQQQSDLLRRTKTNEIVIVDDGLNTYAVFEALAANKPLTRPGQTLSPARRALGLAATHCLRKAAFSGRLTMFTSMPPTKRLGLDAAVIDASVVHHQFEWLAGQPSAEAITEQRVIIGSGFAADHLISADKYVEWVASVAHEHRTRYFPHRRSTPELVERINALPTVTLSQDHASVEVQLRSLGQGQQVHMLPTTALITLSQLLRTRKVDIVPHAVPDDWWQEHTPAPYRVFLARPLALIESL